MRLSNVRITESEWKIMNYLWQKPMTITQLTKALYNETQWTKYTIITLLKRMNDKDVVYFTDNGRTKTFYPKVTRKEAEAEAANGLLKAFFAGRVPSMISALVKRKRMSEADLDEICKALKVECVK